MVSLFFLLVAVLALPAVAGWIWRLQRRTLTALIPGADFDDVAALADLPVLSTLGGAPPAAAGPHVHLLAVTREAQSLFVAYRPVASAAAKVTTVLLDLAAAGNRELAVLVRWHSVRTPVMVDTDPVAGQVAFQEPRTLLTVTLPLLA